MPPDVVPESSTTPEPVETTAESVPPVDATAVPTSTPVAPIVTESWNGLPKYVCGACGFDTLMKDRVELHVQHCLVYLAQLAQQSSPEPAPPQPPGPDAVPESVPSAEGA